MSSPLESLPVELLDEVFFYLDHNPPSEDQVYQKPEHSITKSSERNLKHLAASCSRLAFLIRPRLFVHARLGLHENLDGFCKFFIRWELGPRVKSVVISLPTDYVVQPHTCIQLARVFNILDPHRITILAPPRVIGELLDTTIDEKDGWAFEIRLQILQLTQDKHGDPSAYHTSRTNSPTMILGVRPWTAFYFNEGSSLKAYNHYEYYLSQVPSVLGQWGKEFLRVPPTPKLSTSLQGLRELTYIAVLPFYNHVDHICAVMQRMPQLRVVTVQLAPGHNDRATELEQRGSMDQNDPWMELESSYSIIGFQVRTVPSVTEFCSRDYHIEAVRSQLTRTLDEGFRNNWTHDGEGTWRRHRME
ncbi:hypothetical protein POX_b02766 [Penicillium oxalicum]|uniref:F-box domain-containing protein n=1 Tax=Penicillium oxalicum (strain 114-2 / CGMCC 5302) TaxID=933388 RepID=S7ZIW9_PENO1|nr:hypothetical protein POX_b02766 [Penicillium oxalicum]EPS30224.1 hypothetical protein PDE_05174 [Penicillium oxalicum 114-2]KAI2792724.1 hypothetical protein POX_b02766 [Penicillium oxalicum]